LLNPFSKVDISFDDFRQSARKRLPKLLFEYIDGAASDGSGEAENRKIIRQLRLNTKALINVEKRSLNHKIFRIPSKLPIGIAPMGMVQMAGAGADEAFAKCAAKYEIPVGVSTASSMSLEKYAEYSRGYAWFQLYYMADKAELEKLLNRVLMAGYKTLIFTVDVPEIGFRPNEIRNGLTVPFKLGPKQIFDFALHPAWSLKTLINGVPKFGNFTDTNSFTRDASRAGADWDFLRYLRDHWPNKLVIKGVLNTDDAINMKGIGVDGIYVSNHGGRQLASAPHPIEMLPKIRKALGDDVHIFYDSGLRNGEDLVKAYALGANFAFMGRPWSLAYAANNQHGIENYINYLCKETSVAMAMIGRRKIEEICLDDIYFTLKQKKSNHLNNVKHPFR
jgi:L-lactate dehydrogenase (cytochrome)